MEPRRILNLGCGARPLPCGTNQIINVDAFNKHPEIINFDITKFPYPFPAGEFDDIYLFHTIEHLPEETHAALLIEFRRLLNPGGRVVISYPEFRRVAQNYIDDLNGDRDFWKATVYGRGISEWDRHKSLMDTEYFIRFTETCGLRAIKFHPEKGQDFNTVVYLRKCEPTLTYEKLMEEEFA